MADLSYLYNPHYGIEPFAPNGGAGGALVTGDNLVITAWGDVAKALQPFGIVYEGAMLQPSSQNSNILPQKRVAGGTQAFHSRNSAQFDLMIGNKPPNPFDVVLLVLNPPPELRQQLVGAVTFNGGDPVDLANYTVKKSLMSQYMWRLESSEGASSGNIQNLEDTLFIFGVYLDLGDYTGAPSIDIPLLKTNGADGQNPEFFDRTTAQGVNEMIAAVNSGDFYVPLFLFVELFDTDVNARFTLTYPHSAARG
jgi:hypothetical protein